jgi:hypothetical protein
MLLSPVAPTSGAVIYVDNDTPGGDGSSWAAAFKYLQDALALADANDEIRVAQGTYVPDQSNLHRGGSGDRQATFQLISGVAIRGGYAGYGEPDPNARDIEAYETILSGDLTGNDFLPSSPELLLSEPTRSDNCSHVVTGNGTDETAVLEGLTITGGQAIGPSYADDCGAGMFNFEPCNPTVVRCTFESNCAKYSGGGAYNKDSSPTITDCTFVGNSASYGGGSHNFLSCAKIVNCLFAGNSASTRGGGMVNIDAYDSSPCSPAVRNCMFVGNSAIYDGGGMSNYHSAPEVTNCVFAGNWSERRGGAVSNGHAGNPFLTNCIFVENSADERGGGIWSQSGGPELRNCILWENTAGEEGPQIGFDGAWDAHIKYSCVQGGQADIYIVNYSDVEWGPGNIDTDPCFADALAGDYHLKSQAGRWEPKEGRWTKDELTSPCIDAGDPNSDWTAELWPHGKCVNMGAFGGTPQASMSASSLGNVADVDGSGKVDYIDMKFLADRWLMQRVLLPEDLDRDGSIDSEDFALFAGQWFWGQ